MKKYLIVASGLLLIITIYAGCAREMTRTNPFDPQNVTVTGGGGGGSGSDSYTKLLLHMDGSDTTTVFTDSATISKMVTTVGGANISTAQSKFGGASGYFDGTGDYLTLAASADWTFGTGSFTVDCWVRPTGLFTDYFTIYDTNSVINTDGVSAPLATQNKLGIFKSASQVILGSTVFQNDTWYHIAVVGNGGPAGARTIKLYINGVQEGNTYTNDYDFTNNGLLIAASYGPTAYWKGWIDELRVSKGIARWTANFTPPTAAY